ncbi:MAG TPA: hypothetical protein VGB19_00425 [Actinomycetota bacterium]
MAATPDPLATWLLEQEARALLRRLDRVKPFVLQETMVPAANLMPTAQIAIERYLMAGRGKLRRDVRAFIRWIRGPGRGAVPQEQQRRFTTLRLRFNTALTQFDLFAEALTQRSEQEIGVWLSGLDVAAQDALELRGGFIEPPPAVCYLHRGLGGAIRRARTRLPGGGEAPVAVVRIPRERMIGFGVASSLCHECGHQAAALLNLVESLRPALQEQRRVRPPAEARAWGMWERTISEIVADTWALGKVGISSTLGLIGIVSLPRAFVFRVNVDDPHPFPWIRVLLSCALGNALYPQGPHGQWAELAATWRRFYPTAGLDEKRQQVVTELQATMGAFVSFLLGHRPASLRGMALGDAIRMPDRTPERLIEAYDRWTVQPELMRAAPPTLVFAVLGRARAKGRLSPEREDRLLGDLITHWALKSTLDIAEICARAPRRTRSGPTRVPIATATPTARPPGVPGRPVHRRRELQPSMAST